MTQTYKNNKNNKNISINKIKKKIKTVIPSIQSHVSDVEVKNKRLKIFFAVNEDGKKSKKKT